MAAKGTIRKKKAPKRKPRKKNFPSPDDIHDASGVVIRNPRDVVDIYKQETGMKAKSVSSKVREWVNSEAADKGWSDVKWPMQYPSKTKHAGAVFVKGKLVAD